MTLPALAAAALLAGVGALVWLVEQALRVAGLVGEELDP